MKSPWGHSRSYEVKCVLTIAFDIIEIGQWGWSQCVSLSETRRLTCNMTYLGHLRDLDLSSNFDIKIFTSTRIYFDASQLMKQDGVRNSSLALLIQKLFAKNSFVKKRFFDLS